MEGTNLVRRYRSLKVDESLYDLLTEEQKRIKDKTGMLLSFPQIQQKLVKEWKPKKVRANDLENDESFKI